MAVSSASPFVLCFCSNEDASGSRSLAARFLALRLCVPKISSFFGRERPELERWVGVAPLLDMRDDSWDVKESVVLEEMSRLEAFFDCRGMPYNEASFADIAYCL